MVTFAFYCFLLIILTRMRNGETSTTGNFYLFSKFVWFWWLLNKRVCFIIGGTTCCRTFLMFKVTRCFKMKFDDSILLWVRRNVKVPTFRFITSYYFDVFVIDLCKYFNYKSFLLDILSGHLEPQVLYANSRNAKISDKSTITAKNMIGETGSKWD